MRLCFILLITFLGLSFELPNIVEVKVPPPKSEYSDWYDIFYKSTSIVPFSRTRQKTYFVGKYYKANFMQAQLFCKIMHMHLVTVPSKEENEELKNILHKNNVTGEFWTSGTRMLDGKTWIWMSTAKPVEYMNWGPGQPNNKNDHCIASIKTNSKFIWSDRNCNCRFFFICERSEEETVLYISKKHETNIRKYYRSYFD